MTNPLESFETGRIIQWPEFSIYDDQAGGGNFIEARELDPKEPLSDKDLGELIRGIPNTQAALAVIFLAKHPEGLESHPDGMTAWEFYAGFSQMLGLSEDEAAVTLGTRRNFAKFLRIAAKENIIVARESESSQYSRYNLNPKFRSVSPEFAEVVLSHSFVHSMPFDIFFCKGKNKEVSKYRSTPAMANNPLY